MTKEEVIKEICNLVPGEHEGEYFYTLSMPKLAQFLADKLI